MAATWDPATSTFGPTGSLLGIRTSFAVAALPDGGALVVGGGGAGGQDLVLGAEVFQLR